MKIKLVCFLALLPGLASAAGSDVLQQQESELLKVKEQEDPITEAWENVLSEVKQAPNVITQALENVLTEENEIVASKVSSTSSSNNNYTTQLGAQIQDLHALLQSKNDHDNIPKNIALSGANNVLAKVEGFGLTVDALVDTITALQTSGTVPSSMEPMVQYVRDQLEQASAQTKQVTIDLADSKSALQQMSSFAATKDKKKMMNNKNKKEHGYYDQDDDDDDEDYDHQDNYHYQHQHHHQNQQHYHVYEKMKSHPKLRHHLDFHEAMATGNMDFVMQHMENLHRHHRSFDEQLQRQRRTQSYQVKQCKKLVSCVEDWSLYDVVSLYYGVYVDDSGKLADNAMAAGAEGTKGIWNQVNEIRKWMNQARSQKYALAPCNSLVNQFYTNENKTEYSIYHGQTISRICRAQGSTKYITIGEIRKKIGPGIADQLFDDMVRCSSSLGDSTFFNKNGPRIPSKAIGDRHGKTRYNDVNKHFGFIETNPLSGAHTSNKDQRISYDDIKRVDPGCVSRINDYYMNLYNKQSTTLFKPGAVTANANYPSLNILVSDMMDRVYIGIGNNPKSSEQICEISRSDFTKCPQDKNKNAGNVFSACNSGITKFTLNGLFSGFNDGARDKASLLALGEKMSVGMVCAYAEKARQNPKGDRVPGYCCLDAPPENNLWGDEYSCDDGKAKCKMLGPTLSGLSQSACDPWSGKWCPYPRDCSELKNCVTGEMTWAKANKKKSYLGYLENIPTINNTMSFDQCGDVREYLGFKPDYPLDDEICEDLQFLRNDKNFNNLDPNFGADAVKKKGEPPKVKELIPPEDPEFTQEQYDEIDKKIKALQITSVTLQAAEKISGYFECPEDLTGAVKTACALTKNALTILSVKGVEMIDKIIETLEGQKPVVSKHQNFEVYHNVDVLFKNMKILNGGIGDIRTDIYNLESKRRLLEHGNSLAKFAGCDGKDQDGDGVSDNCEEDWFPPELVIRPGMGLETGNKAKQVVTDRVFKSNDEASAHLKTILSVSDDCADASSLELNLTVVGRSEDSCISTIRAKPIHMCDGFATVGKEHLFDAMVHTQPPVVSCGFNGQDLEVKTLFIETDHSSSTHLKDTGFFFKIKDSCSNSVKVDISVKSSEYELPEAGSLAKALAVHMGGADVARVLVSPSTCESRKRSAGVFCESASERKERIYEIQVTATNEAGWTAAEICRVIVLSNEQSEDNRNLAGGGEFESTPMYKIDEVSLQWKP